jgi:hypothetical protein
VRIAIVKNWPGYDLERQWPTNPPADLSNVEFDLRSTDGADFIIVLNGPPDQMTVECAPDKIWALIQEPPTPYHVAHHVGQPAFRRIYTTDSRYKDERHIQFFGALEWHVGKSYDELLAEKYPQKSGTLSWVTSDNSGLDGHRLRMKFLRRLQESNLPFSLFGHGFNPIKDKWDGVAPYRYSIAFENFADDLYWSEKLTDCFLSFATPFYFGTETIGRYFPKGSYIQIDPFDRHVFRKMQDKIDEGFHEQNIEAMNEARHLCLNCYNTLFFIAREVLAYEPAISQRPTEVLLVKIPPKGWPPTRWKLHIQHRARRLGRRLWRRVERLRRPSAGIGVDRHLL